ncbi:MAG TPA: response regulator transcription factor [Polyangia bacterium]
MKVLVVEDDVKLARFLQRALTEEGYDVVSAKTGDEALAAVDAESPDMLLLDWMIPEPDGLEVCRRLRSQGKTLPILLLTARGELQDRVAGLDTGADDYLVKPFEIEELVARLRALSRRVEGGVPSSITVGRIYLDWRARVASVDGRPVELTTREFDLLAYFLRHPGQVLSKNDLLQGVWRLTFEPGTNVVEVHISRLRSKLGDADSVIETIRGGGYRLRSRSDG